LLQSSETLKVDSIPPTLRDAAPDPEATVSTARPNVYVLFDDQGSGIDVRTIRLQLDGREVSSGVNATRSFLSYTPDSPLNAGYHRVQVAVMDKAGNRAELLWKFNVAATAGIRTVTHNANRTLEPGDTLHVEANGTPNGAATFSVGNIKDVPLQERKPGIYSADYTIRKGDDTSGSKLALRLVTRGGERFAYEAPRAIKVRTGKPDMPKIAYPRRGETPPSKLTVRGTATPNAEIRIRIDYVSKLGGLLPVKGVALDTAVHAGKDGKWETEEVNLRGLLSNSKAEYTLTVIATNSDGEDSEPAVMVFTAR
jgi:hypothetical protein